MRDIAPVATVANAPYVVLVTPSLPAKTVPEFIAYAKANPGKINMASGGIGTASHIFGVLFMTMAGIELVHVPYRTNYMPDLISGQVQVVINPMPQSMEFVKAGKSARAGGDHQGAIGRAPRPSHREPIRARLRGDRLVRRRRAEGHAPRHRRQAQRRRSTPRSENRRRRRGLPTWASKPMRKTPAEFGEFLAAENEKWGGVIRAAKIKLD